MAATTSEDGGWSTIRRTVARFEEAWRRGERPRIDDYLDGAATHRGQAVVELVHAELEFRLKAGEAARVEAYQDRYPEELARDRDSLVELIVTEWSIRRRIGPEPEDGDYQTRFPRLFAAFLERRERRSVEPRSGSPLDKLRAVMSQPPDPGIALPSMFGRFELRELLGKGSFGLVYRGWDTVMKRDVAVKIPREGALISTEDTQTFLREARIASMLSHPSIVPLYETSTIDGTAYIVSKYIEGRTLADAIVNGPLPFATSAELMTTVAEALHYAHEHPNRVIHRDLKPSNILLDSRDMPHLTDFGLAQREGGESSAILAADKATIGTPAYMSPEQVCGERLCPKSDVFSAGIVLYELLTGELPFRGFGRMLEAQIQEDDPLPPTRLNDAVPPDLESICLKALAKDPSDRYSTAQEFADDLRHYLQGEPIGATRPKSPSRRLWKRIRSQPVQSLFLLYLLLAGIVGIPMLCVALWNARSVADRPGRAPVASDLPNRRRPRDVQVDDPDEGDASPLRDSGRNRYDLRVMPGGSSSREPPRGRRVRSGTPGYIPRPS